MVQTNFYEGGAGNLLVVGAGQSLMANWQKAPSNDDFNNQGGNAFIDMLNAVNKNGSNTFINSGDGSSCLLRSTCISTSQGEQDDYWIDDCGSYPSGTAPWNGTTGVKSYFRGETATLPTIGARYQDMLDDIAAAGKLNSQVIYNIWNQGESEASTLYGNDLTEAQLVAALQWYLDKIFVDFPRLRKMILEPIGRRAYNANSGYEEVRNAQRTLAANNPTKVILCPDMYDLPMRNTSMIAKFRATAGQTVFSLPFNISSLAGLPLDITKNGTLLTDTVDYTVNATTDNVTFTSGCALDDVIEFYSSDTVHRSPLATVKEAQRVARVILKDFGKYSGNTVGAKITSAAVISGGIIEATVTHDAGDTLQNFYEVPYTTNDLKPVPVTPTTPTGRGALAALDAGGAEIPVQAVTITGTNKIQIVPQGGFQILSNGNKLYTGYSDMYQIDHKSIILDNGAGNALPLRSGSVTFNGGGLSLIDSMPNLVSFFQATAPYNAAGTAIDADVWLKRAGSGGNARKDDAKPAPVYYADSNMGLAYGGFYYDGIALKKLFVNNALTASSDYTVIVVATPDTAISDPVSSSVNCMVSTLGGASGDNNLFFIGQNGTTLGNRTALTVEQGTTAFASLAGRKTGISVVKKQGTATAFFDETRKIITKTTANTAVIHSDGGTPVYAIGNAAQITSGYDNVQCYVGAIHAVIVFDAALSDAQINQIRFALGDFYGITVT